MNVQQNGVFESINQIGVHLKYNMSIKYYQLKRVKLKQITKSYYNLKQNNKYKLYPKTLNFY